MKYTSTLFFIICSSLIPVHPVKDVRPTKEEDKQTEEQFALLQLIEREASELAALEVWKKDSEQSLARLRAISRPFEEETLAAITQLGSSKPQYGKISRLPTRKLKH